MADHVVYQGRDLEAMSFAVNYHKWILDAFRPYLGVRLVEVGAGTGSFSEMLIAGNPESLDLVEPSPAMHNLLLKKIRSLNTKVTVQTHNTTFRSVATELQAHQQPDSVIYVNVLEHIEDDLGELETIHQTLVPGGRLFIFVPALRWLYGSFDRKVGHVRRYSYSELQKKCEQTGFKVIKSTYFDVTGVVGWWLKYCLLKSPNMEPGAVKLYDQLVVPPLKRIESVVAPPFGKNLLFVAERM